MTTKQEIIRWYHTSVLPSGSTDELNAFMQDIAITYDAFWRMPDGLEVGTVYKNLSRAMKAYNKYGFTPEDILKIHPKHDEIIANTVKVKSAPEDYEFTGFRYKVPGRQTETIMR